MPEPDAAPPAEATTSNATPETTGAVTFGPNTLLAAEDIHKTFYLGRHSLTVLRGATLALDRGGITYILGASGAGKSTLLHIMGLLDTPTAGRVRLDMRDPEAAQKGEGEPDPRPLSEQDVETQSAVRNRRFGFVFQFHHLLGEFTALENVLMPAMIGTGPVPYFMGERGRQHRERANELLKMIGLVDRRHHRPAQLSGGERQRIAFARALINKPDVIFCDEPTGNLDSRNAHALYALIHDLRDTFGQAFVIVTHDEHRVESLLQRPNVSRCWIHDGGLYWDRDRYLADREATRQRAQENGKGLGE